MKKVKKNIIGSRKPSNIIFDLLNYGFLIVLAIACLYPMLHILFASLSEPSKLMRHHGFLLHPLGFTLQGYTAILKNNMLMRGFANTLVYVSLGTLVNMVMTAMGAFALSRRDLLLKKGFMIIITITMFFGGGLIPWYLTMKSYGLYNNLWAMILPGALSTWNMIIMRTGFQSVPYELEEAAIIDGASQAGILTKVILPLSKPVLAVIFLYYVVGHWNSWFNAMVLLNDRDLYPLQLFLKEILMRSDRVVGSIDSGARQVMEYGDLDGYQLLIRYCMVIVSSTPILCLYPFLQKYFVKGVFVGSLKG